MFIYLIVTIRFFGNFILFYFHISSGAIRSKKTAQLFICFKCSVSVKNKSGLGNEDFESCLVSSLTQRLKL